MKITEQMKTALEGFDGEVKHCPAGRAKGLKKGEAQRQWLRRHRLQRDAVLLEQQQQQEDSDRDRAHEAMRVQQVLDQIRDGQGKRSQGRSTRRKRR